MVLDILTLILMLITALRHTFRGVTRSIVHLAQWITVIILSLMFTDTLRDALEEYTPIDHALRDIYSNLILTTIQRDGGASSLPEFLVDGLNKTSTVIAEHAASELTSITMTVISVILIILFVKLIASIILSLTNMAKRFGPLRFLDGLAGFAIGIIIGIINVSIFLALVRLCQPFLGASEASWLNAQLHTSVIASVLYHHNIARWLVRALL